MFLIQNKRCISAMLKTPISDEIIIADAVGKTVYSQLITETTSNIKLQTTNLVSGVYILQIKTKEFFATKKVLVKH